jgi:hypothetical protein
LRLQKSRWRIQTFFWWHKIIPLKIVSIGERIIQGKYSYFIAKIALPYDSQIKKNFNFVHP